MIQVDMGVFHLLVCISLDNTDLHDSLIRARGNFEYENVETTFQSAEKVHSETFPINRK